VNSRRLDECLHEQLFARCGRTLLALYLRRRYTLLIFAVNVRAALRVLQPRAGRGAAMPGYQGSLRSPARSSSSPDVGGAGVESGWDAFVLYPAG
jgi:hypothetical protein